MAKVKTLFAGLCGLALSVVAALAVEPQPILLWPDGAPGSEGKTAPETMRTNPPDDQVVSNVNFPSITPYLPDPDKATGAAVIIIPGGGYREIWVSHEGTRVAQFLSEHGVAAFVLKYRLGFAPGSTYTISNHSLPDVQRAIRVVKNRAAEWCIDPARVGVMGFSAGGELATLAGMNPGAGNPGAADPVDREASRPAFLGLIYPYLGGILPAAPAEFLVPKDMPPAFLIGGDKDKLAKPLPGFYLTLEKAGVPAELHLLTGVEHGFGIRATNPPHVAIWTTLFVNWLDAAGMLKAK